MASCELCGADNVATRRVPLHGAFVEGCRKCQEKMGFTEEQVKHAHNVTKVSSPKPRTQSGGYGGLGRAGKDIMVRREKELSPRFASIIREARESRGWDQRKLALTMKEKINIIQRTESGTTPTDALVKKFERVLSIQLMVDSDEVSMETRVEGSNSRSLNLGDLIKMAREKEE